MSYPQEFTKSFFNESAKRWKQNKNYIGDGTYEYKKDAFLSESDFPPAPKPKLKIKIPPVEEKEPPIIRRSARLRAAKFK